MADPGGRSLSPEGKAAIAEAVTTALTDGASVTDAVAETLVPLLAERDGEARALRAALESIRDGRVPMLGGVPPSLFAFATGALAASTTIDPCSDCDRTGIGGHGGTCPTCQGARVVQRRWCGCGDSLDGNEEIPGGGVCPNCATVDRATLPSSSATKWADRLTSDDFVAQIAATSVLDQKDMIAAMAQLSRDCAPDAERHLLRGLFAVVGQTLDTQAQPSRALSRSC